MNPNTRRDANGLTPSLRIGELGRRVGVRPETLRAWERRYGLLEPARTPNGYRLYSAADEARVRSMVAWLARGRSAAEAAELARGRPPLAERTERPVLASAGERLIEAIQAFDDESAHRVLDHALARFSLATVLSGIVLPVLAEVGDRWVRGEATIGQEHFCTELLRGRLLALARAWGGGSGPLALLACPPDERHDLGLVCFGLVLRESGWRIAFLGPDTPMPTLDDAADRLDPEAIVITAVVPDRLERVRRELAAIAERHSLSIAGAGANPEMARSIGAVHLVGRPVEAARWLAGEASPRQPT